MDHSTRRRTASEEIHIEHGLDQGEEDAEGNEDEKDEDEHNCSRTALVEV
jgi:hypothetical protein